MASFGAVRAMHKGEVGRHHALVNWADTSPTLLFGPMYVCLCVYFYYCVCVLLLQDLLQSCARGGDCVCFITAGPITKLCEWGEEESGGHVL